MIRPVPVPINLGCCPADGPRCLLCVPRDPPDAEAVAAMVSLVRSDRPDAPLQVRFFGGAPPSPALVDAADGLPLSVRVRPDCLTRADAARLAQAGCVEVELDAWTFHDAALAETGRPYKASLVREQSAGLAAMGIAVGGVLACGLPRTDHALAVKDAHEAATIWSFARLHPVIVLDRSGLAERHALGRYTPLTLSEAVTTTRAQLDVLEGAGVAVRRIGQQPGPDALGRAVAGPVHPALRELVESRRTLDRLRDQLGIRPPGAHVQVRCAVADETRVRGPRNHNLHVLRQELDLRRIDVTPDPTLDRGELVVQRAHAAETA